MKPDTPRRRDEPVMCGCETKTALPCQNDRIPGFGVCSVHAMDALRTGLEALKEMFRQLWDAVSDVMREIAQSFQSLQIDAQAVPSLPSANTLPVLYDSRSAQTRRENQP